MITRYSVWLNGQGLQDIDDSIVITDVQEASPRMTAYTAANARYPGLHLTRQFRQSLSVTVRFSIREYDVARRKSIADAVVAWACKGGRLTTSDRTGQVLDVVCADAPCATSALKWTDALSMTFIAYAVPYWQDEHPLCLTVNLAAGVPLEAEIAPTGTAAHCALCFDAENRGAAAAKSLTISTGDSLFRLADPALIPVGDTLSLGYKDSFLFLRNSAGSMLHARSADSSDDLLLTPGRYNAVTFTADQPMQIRVNVRGLYQ